MTHTADFIEEVLHEVNVILQDLADEATARGIVRAVYDKVHVGPVHTERARKDELVALMETTRDLCVAHLLGLARRDFSTHATESRAVCLLLRFVEPQIRAAVRRRIRCAHDFDPVVNDVRLRIWRGLRSFEGGRGQLHYYVKRACESACTDLRRRTPDCEQLADRHRLAGQREDDSQRHTVVELKAFLRQSLPLLPRKERLAVEAFLVFDGNWAAAQEALDIPRQTLAGWFTAALRRLRKLWGFND
jgi:DNA-directed RNA polymerase specialized sigma24 family protein